MGKKIFTTLCSKSLSSAMIKAFDLALYHAEYASLIMIWFNILYELMYILTSINNYISGHHPTKKQLVLLPTSKMHPCSLISTFDISFVESIVAKLET